MKTFELNINGIPTSLLINTLVQKRYAEQAGLKFVNETISSLQAPVDGDGNVSISFELIDRYCILIHEAAKEAARRERKALELSLEDCYSVFDDIEQVKKFINVAILGEMPVAEEPSKTEDPAGNA